MVYMALFGLGHVLLGPFWKGVVLLAVSAICAGALYSNISRSDWGAEEGELLATSPKDVARATH